jgi:hypothetical protein
MPGYEHGVGETLKFLTDQAERPLPFNFYVVKSFALGIRKYTSKGIHVYLANIYRMPVQTHPDEDHT